MARPATTQTAHSRQEIDKFNRLAAGWWDPRGPMAPLHWMNPARLGFIHEQLATADIAKPAGVLAPSGLDLGCGAGLLTEPLARRGYRMTGIDGAADAIAVAQTRTAAEGLRIDYRVGHSDELQNAAYDFVTALEIIEHADEPAAFVRQVACVVRPGGVLFLSTLNRTLASRAFAIWGAEYLLRALPVGTHDWRKFLKPSELSKLVEAAGCEVVALEGLVFQPRARAFRRDPHNLAINYILAARKL